MEKARGQSFPGEHQGRAVTRDITNPYLGVSSMVLRLLLD